MAKLPEKKMKIAIEIPYREDRKDHLDVYEAFRRLWLDDEKDSDENALGFMMVQPRSFKHFRDPFEAPKGRMLKHSLMDTFVMNAAAMFTGIRERYFIQYIKVLAVVNYYTVLNPYSYLDKPQGEYSNLTEDDLLGVLHALKLMDTLPLVIYDPKVYTPHHHSTSTCIELKRTQDGTIDIADLHANLERFFKLYGIIGTRAIPTEEDV